MISSVPLSDVLTFHRGLTFKPEDRVEVGSNDSIVCFRTKNIQEELDESDLIAIPSAIMKREELEVITGDILISTANSWDLVGKCVRVKTTKFRSTLGGFISLLRPKANTVDPDYLYRFLMMDSTQHRIRNLGKQTTNISNLDRVRFLEIEIPLPPLETQKQIAAILEKADQLRKDCQQMEQELNNLAQSVFMDMFGDPVSNPKGWEKSKLGSLVSVMSGATPSKSKTEYWKGDFPWVSPKDMKSNEINDSIDHVNQVVFKETNLKMISVDSILIVVRGMILAHTVPIAIVKTPVSINQDIKALALKENKIKPEMLLNILHAMHSSILSIVSTAAHGTKRIDINDLLNLDIITPSLDVQTKYLNAIKSIKSALEAKSGIGLDVQELFNSLMQKAFKGDLNIKTKAA